MSSLHMFLPASEPARSEALALLQKTHRLPRHLVRGIVPGAFGKRAAALPTGPDQVQQQTCDSPPEAQIQTG
jgi:hypothetical protein